MVYSGFIKRALSSYSSFFLPVIGSLIGVRSKGSGSSMIDNFFLTSGLFP